MSEPLMTALERDIEWLRGLKDQRADDIILDIRDALTLLDLRKAHIDYLLGKRRVG